VDGRRNACRRRKIGAHEADLSDLSQRLDVMGAARVAGSDADPDAPFQQAFADVAADEAAAAEDGHKLLSAFQTFHGRRPSGSAAPLTRRREAS
jgi:hypothetical protein